MREIPNFPAQHQRNFAGLVGRGASPADSGKSDSPAPASANGFSSIAAESSASGSDGKEKSPEKSSGRSTPQTPQSAPQTLARQGSTSALNLGLNLSGLGLDGAGTFNLGKRGFADRKQAVARRQSKTWAAETSSIKPLEQLAEELCMHAIKKGCALAL